jgi:hypothetical protein
VSSHRSTPPTGPETDERIRKLHEAGLLDPKVPAEPVTATSGNSSVLPLETQSDQQEGSPGNTVTPPGPSPIALRRVAWTAKELLSMDLAEPTWAVPGLIPTGVTLLVGPPKIGKSWMGLGISVAVATGGKALGKIEVDPGEVLYLALEDTARRLKSRLRMMLPRDNPGPETLTLAIECPPCRRAVTNTSPPGWTSTPTLDWSS